MLKYTFKKRNEKGKVSEERTDLSIIEKVVSDYYFQEQKEDKYNMMYSSTMYTAIIGWAAAALSNCGGMTITKKHIDWIIKTYTVKREDCKSDKEFEIESKNVKDFINLCERLLFKEYQFEGWL